MYFLIHFSPEKAELRLTHNLSILSSFMLRKMWVMDSFERGGRREKKLSDKVQSFASINYPDSI